MESLRAKVRRELAEKTSLCLYTLFTLPCHLHSVCKSHTGAGGGDVYSPGVAAYDSYYSSTVQVKTVRGGESDHSFAAIHRCLPQKQGNLAHRNSPMMKISVNGCFQGDWTEKAFKHQRLVLQANAACKKPSPDAFMKFVQPISDVISQAESKVQRLFERCATQTTNTNRPTTAARGTLTRRRSLRASWRWAGLPTAARANPRSSEDWRPPTST